MKKNRLFILFFLASFFVSAQDLIKSYSHLDGYSIIPKLVLERQNDIVVPYYITKGDEKKAGILFLDKAFNINDAILFEGEGAYVINDLKESLNGNLLVSAEGYSPQNQESIYFIELKGKEIVNEFIFNENGNEVDPFSIIEVDNHVIFGGFVKIRKLIGNSFYNIYSEDQMMYISRFTKDGEKQWSNAIDLDGYNQEICNKVVFLNNNLFLLSHAHEIDGNISPFLVKMNTKGEFIKMIKLSNKDNIIGISDLVSHNNQLLISGTYKDNNTEYYYNAKISENLVINDANSFILPSRIVLSDSYIYNDTKHVYGTLFTDNNSYNYLFMKDYISKVEYQQSGTPRMDYLIGQYDNKFIGYSSGNNNDYRADIVVLKNIISDPVTLEEAPSFLLESSNFTKYNIITDFDVSSVNSGCKQIYLKNIKNKIK